MNLTKLIEFFASYGCNKLYVKTLAANDNSKNQIYLGGSFEILNIFPSTNITAEGNIDWGKARFKTDLDFYWINNDGTLHHAPNSQLILYPKYPEVRFSGFLKSCDSPPSDLMTIRLKDRVLFFGFFNQGNKILGYVCHPESAIAREFRQLSDLEKQGVFDIIYLTEKTIGVNSRQLLLREFARIHALGWIDSKKLDSFKNIHPCDASQCGGYTLEAELGIPPNSNSEPDFLGWEVKQFGVKNLNRLLSSTITLMTPEPTGGHYVEKGIRSFIFKFGYKDKLGRPDRMNFGGVHRANEQHKSTELTMKLMGFDYESGKIRNPQGNIVLVSTNGEIAASWSFTSLMKHWRLKHAKAAYVPSLLRIQPKRQYRYGPSVILGVGTSFDRFLKLMHEGHIYYDPGIKMVNVSGKQATKRRSQFRIRSRYVPELYEQNEIVNVGGSV